MSVISETTFQIIYAYPKLLDFESNFHLKKTSLVQIMAWYRAGDNSLTEPTVVYFYGCNFVSLGLGARRASNQAF